MKGNRSYLAQTGCEEPSLSFKPLCSSWQMNMYSKTSNNGPSGKRTTFLQRTAHLPPIDFTIELIHFEPPRSGHLSTLNNRHWSGPDVPWPIQNYLRKWTVKLHLHNADTCPTAFVMPPSLDSMTEHYISTVLAFLVSVKQRRGPKMLVRPITHITTPTGSIPNAYNGYLRIRTRSAAVVLATVLTNEIFLLQTTFECLVIN